MINVALYREVFSIPFFKQSFNEFSLEGMNIKLIDCGGINEGFEIDKLLSKKVGEGKKEKPDIVFIPSIIGLPLSYNGIRLAMHWRLDTENTNSNYIPIVIMGFENESSFFRNCDYSSFLKTPNVYYIDYNQEAIKGFIQQFQLKTYSKHDFESALKYYYLQPPASYKSHHAITNEWSILRWADALNISNVEIYSIKNFIGHSLYYKFLKTKYPITKYENASRKILLNRGKVLYIDDEVEKGWDSIFRHIVRQNYYPFGKDFKSNKSKEEIINASIEEVEIKDPAVVILDLRLHDDDFGNENSPAELTGLKILKKIKSFNSGIQVIVFSATNKVWNLLELQKEGADGFIMKESPELSIDKEFTKNSIGSIYNQLDECLRMGFLKKICDKIKVVRKIIVKQQQKELSKGFSNFYKRTFANLEIAFDLLSGSRKSEKYRNYGYLQIFHIIEDFVELDEVFEVGDSCYVQCNESSVLVLRSRTSQKSAKTYQSALIFTDEKNTYTIKISDFVRRIDTYFKVCSLLLFRYGFDSSNELYWNSINYNRNNKAAHGGSNEYVKDEELYQLLDFLIFILDDLNQNEKNVKDGLL